MLFGQQGHLPDGIMTLDNKQIAIEVELSRKSKLRLEAILKAYAAQFSIQTVWYFVRNRYNHAYRLTDKGCT